MIPDKAVEAVENEIRKHFADYFLPGDLVFPDEELSYCARKFAEAVAPYIEAQALSGIAMQNPGMTFGQRVWLKERAEELSDDDEADKTPDLRVLQHGDPEPGRDTRWRDQHRDEWRYNGRGWAISDQATGSVWPGAIEMGRRYFPMTEVTE